MSCDHDRDFTGEERARAREIRAWAEDPAHYRARNARQRKEDAGGVFLGVRTCFSITVLENGQHYRVITFSSPELDPPPAFVTCARIAVGLFAFDFARLVRPTVDPDCPFVVGFAQELTS